MWILVVMVCINATLHAPLEIGIEHFPLLDLLADGDDAIEVNESFTDDQDIDGNKSNSDWPLFDHVRSQDIRLLKTLNVGTIVDFMVEKKKVKFGLK